ncbi:MAG: metal-sulfur cluster assembly factor [Candidatus Aenigmarchaeota archaeon]|nr:metal-sulfur cluster assembly factor [Candidatus Aenigmarchaeota archaeon]
MPTEAAVRDVLSGIVDPEMNYDLVTLGLIYKVQCDSEGNVSILMTFTSMLCPFGPQLVDEIRRKVMALEGTKTVDVEVTFNPPWKPSEELMATLGL